MKEEEKERENEIHRKDGVKKIWHGLMMIMDLGLIAGWLLASFIRTIITLYNLSLALSLLMMPSQSRILVAFVVGLLYDPRKESYFPGRFYFL